MNTRREFFGKVGTLAGGVGLLAYGTGVKQADPFNIRKGSVGGRIAESFVSTAPMSPTGDVAIPQAAREAMRKLYIAAIQKLDPLHELREAHYKDDNYRPAILGMCFMCREYDFTEKLHYNYMVSDQVCEDCCPKEITKVLNA